METEKDVFDVYEAVIDSLSDSFIANLSQEGALKILDDAHSEALKLTCYDSAVDFGDYDYPTEKLGRLLMKAFYPKRFNRWGESFSGYNDWEQEEMWDEWHENVMKPFMSRYSFTQPKY